jgi:hypothetical protein
MTKLKAEEENWYDKRICKRFNYRHDGNGRT